MTITISAVGAAALVAAFGLAINSFFRQMRGRAIGVGMALTGVGATFMPLVMSNLLHAFGWRYTILILGALSLHTLVAACLLRPVKWYYKKSLKFEEVPLRSEHKIELINCEKSSMEIGKNFV
jgi:MFS family permease